MKRFILALAALSMLVLSCTKEIDNPAPNTDSVASEDIVFNITVTNPSTGDDTRAYIKTGWTDGDEIKIWFDTSTNETPGLVIKYNATEEKWEPVGEPVIDGLSLQETGGYAKSLYSGDVAVAAKDNYTYNSTTNALNLTISSWTFLTKLQVVVTDLTPADAANYTLACDRFSPYTGFTVGADAITATTGIQGVAVTGIANTDGAAFVFADNTQWGTAGDYKFTLGSQSETNSFVVNTTIAKPDENNSKIKGLKVSASKFSIPVADLLDVAFNLSGTATDISARHMNIEKFGSPTIVDYSQSNRMAFSAAVDSLGDRATNYYKVDYSSDDTFKAALADGHTLECLVKTGPSIGTGESTPFSSWEYGGTGLELDNQEFVFPVWVGSGYCTAHSGVMASASTYYHLIGVYNKTAGKVSIYVNGACCGETAAKGDYGHPENGCHWFGIGTDPDYLSNNYGWTGDIVFARIYDAPLNSGQVGYLYEHRNDALPTTGTDGNGHDWVQLWKGGPRWSTTNVGADTPEKYGYYYAWRETKPKDNYNESNFRATDDTAQAIWGWNWRTPTYEDWDGLINKCDLEWTDSYKITGIAGRIVKGKGAYADNSIFLPAAGYCHNTVREKNGTQCLYWTSSLYSPELAWCVLFSKTGISKNKDVPYYGRPVRPVL